MTTKTEQKSEAAHCSIFVFHTQAKANMFGHVSDKSITNIASTATAAEFTRSCSLLIFFTVLLK